MLLRNPRVVLACFGVALAAAAVSWHYFLLGQPFAALENSSAAGEPEQAALEAGDVQVVGRSGGRVRWRMAAQTVSLSRDRRVISITGIRRGALYAADNRPSVALTADRASYATPFGILGAGGMGALRVEGHVRALVLTASHLSLRTEQIVWDSATNGLVCPLPVTAALPNLTVTAGNSRYDSPPGAPAQGAMHLGGGVHARFDSTRGMAVLDCPGLAWNAGSQTAQTLGPVTATIPGGLGTATAADVSVNTRTGDLSGHGFRGTLRLSREVQ